MQYTVYGENLDNKAHLNVNIGIGQQLFHGQLVTMAA